MRDVGIITKDEFNDAAMTGDEFQEGFAKMKLVHLYDVIAIISGVLADNAWTENILKSAEIKTGYSRVRKFIEAQQLPKAGKTSWFALQGKMSRLVRLNIFDIGQGLDFEKMTTLGMVSIVDLSDTDDSKVRNLVIAEMLRGIQLQQETNFKQSVSRGVQPDQTLIFIEEAHEFLSRERISQMPTLFSQVAKIAKRGRKRKLGLVFITQLPQHLPNEVIGLINNWILHKIADASVISRLKQGIGGLNDTQWGNLKSLAPGQAICSFVSMARPLQVSIDPTPCKLLMIE